MQNPLTAGREALLARLATITKANGYLTDAGLNVRAGWFNEILQSGDLAFPLIVLQKGKDLEPEPAGRGLKAMRGFLVVGAVSVGIDGYEDAIDALELDLLRCLRPERGQPLPWAPTGVSNITIGGGEQYPPGNGERAASVLVPVYLHTFITGI
jgi:hypothetical protein